MGVAGGVYSIRLYRWHRSIPRYAMTRGKRRTRDECSRDKEAAARHQTAACFLEYLSDGVTREEFWQVCTPYFSSGNVVVLVLYQRTMSVVLLTVKMYKACQSSVSLLLLLGPHNNKSTRMPGGYWVETAKKKEAGEYVRYRYRRVVYAR